VYGYILHIGKGKETAAGLVTCGQTHPAIDQFEDAPVGINSSQENFYKGADILTGQLSPKIFHFQ
jgi:hypothetical protein